MRYFAHTKETIDIMLKAINKSSLDELFATIPESARLKSALRLPKRLDELQIKRITERFGSLSQIRSFLGAGATAHFVPEWVSQQLLRAEWYTSYTPYQPEASQGTLQAIFEFQSMVASLFGFQVANASLYDGATALTEALLMAIRLTKRKTVILPITIHPEYRQTAHTYLSIAGFTVKEIGFDDSGEVSLFELEKALQTVGEDCAAIALQSPNFFGRIEPSRNFCDLAKDRGALLIGICTDISACALLPSFGQSHFNIAVGEGLSFVGGINLGGPGVGLFATELGLIRQMPGRLCGETLDSFGRVGYVFTLSTREQHIRREKATSNICTNHNLTALALSMALSAYGKSGLLDLAKTNVKKTLFFRRNLEQLGQKIAFFGPHYNETVVKFENQAVLEQRLILAKRRNFIAGLPLVRFYKNLAGHLLVSTTELHDDEGIYELATVLSGAHSA